VEVFGSSFIDDLTYVGDVEVCMECVIFVAYQGAFVMVPSNKLEKLLYLVD
jgi:hypothetical protein